MSRARASTRELLEAMRRCRPSTRAELGAYVEAFLGLKAPARRVCEGHDSPMDYLAYSFLGIEPEGGRRESGRDCVVWANRGGGKTQLGAVASLLECVFLPGCQVRILGGSEQQSGRMYEYLKRGVESGFEEILGGRMTQKGCSFANGSDVAVLSQSDRSVRGHHVPRLRCDELELFDREVWQAAQFVTQGRGGACAQLEAFSTMHKPFGLMHEVVRDAGTSGMRVFRWCLWEVIEKCEGRTCGRCCLSEDCRGRAKEGTGYYRIEDAIAQKKRSSKAAWRAEMLCERANREDLVFGEFEAGRHVREAEYNPGLALYRAIDFGFTHPLACLFLQVDEAGCVRVLDEHVKSRTTLAEHARLIRERYPQRVEATYCDPAGRQEREITGTCVMTELAALGIPCRCRGSRVLEGLEMIRQRLSPAEGEAKLVISPRCRHLIRSFEGLRYERLKSGALSELPEKDGVHDHVMDALRYFFVNRFGRKYGVKEVRY